jgi:hypothetical protein
MKLFSIMTMLDLIQQQQSLKTIQKLKFELLPHPAYSPILTTYNYHISGLLKHVLHGCQFANNEEVKDMMHMWLRAQPKTFFTDGMRKLVN